MLRLAREHNIPAAPVHDSLIVPRSKEVVAHRILDEQFTKIIGVVPKLKLSPENAAFFSSLMFIFALRRLSRI